VRVSLAIATKGRPDDLRETLAALARCDPPPDELVVVDGDEARSAEPVVAEFAGKAGGPPVRYLHSAPGLTRQRNVALEAVTGDVVAFVDDDVALAPDAFARLAQAYDDAAVVGATGRVDEPQGRRFGNSRSRVRSLLFRGGEDGTMTRFGYPRRLQDLDGARDVEFMPGCLMSARTALARDVRFDERLDGYGLAEDEDFSYRLSRRGRVRFVPELRVDHKNTGGSGSGGREFNRAVVVNRAYLFRKNFRRTPLARVQFALLVLLLAAHRAVNREWQGLRGLAEGAIEAWRRPL
jgi:GT2 family glycosyltransferase